MLSAVASSCTRGIAGEPAASCIDVRSVPLTPFYRSSVTGVGTSTQSGRICASQAVLSLLFPLPWQDPAAQLLLLLFCLLAFTSNDSICTEEYLSGVREGGRCWFGGMHSIAFRISFDKTCKVRCVHLDALEATSFQAFWKLSMKVSAYDFRNLSICVWHDLARVVMAGNSLEPSEPAVPLQLDERSEGLRHARLSSTAQPWNQGNRSLPSGLIGCYLISEQKYLNW